MAVARTRRLASFSYQGRHRYLITLCTERRTPRFIDGIIVTDVLAQFERSASEHHFELLAYCFVPDHAHLLVEGSRVDSDLQRFVRLAKQRGEYAARRRGVYPLWQAGYHDTVLKSWESIEPFVRYILQNPVRAGLVARSELYPYSGSSVTAGP
jgi:putative transposase